MKMKNLLNYGKEQAYGDYLEDPMLCLAFLNLYSTLSIHLLCLVGAVCTLECFTRTTHSYTYSTHHTSTQCA